MHLFVFLAFGFLLLFSLSFSIRFCSFLRVAFSSSFLRSSSFFSAASTQHTRNQQTTNHHWYTHAHIITHIQCMHTLYRYTHICVHVHQYTTQKAHIEANNTEILVCTSRFFIEDHGMIQIRPVQAQQVINRPSAKKRENWPSYEKKKKRNGEQLSITGQRKHPQHTFWSPHDRDDSHLFLQSRTDQL